MTSIEERQHRIFQLICEGKHTFKSLHTKISDEFSRKYGKPLSVRTLRNDLKAVSKHPSVGRPYQTRGQPAIYFYEELTPRWKPQGAQFSQEQVQALEIACAGMGPVHKLPESEPLREALRTATSLVPSQKASTQALDISEVVFFADNPIKEIEADVWNSLLKACRQRLQIHMTYQKGWSKEPDFPERKTYDLCPLALFSLEGEWYLWAYKCNEETEQARDQAMESQTKLSVSSGAFVQFNVSRIEKVIVAKQHFIPPPDFKPREILKSTFKKFIGHSGDPVVDVTLWFAKDVWPLVVNHRFHPMQTRYCPDEEEQGWTVTFPVTTSAAANGNRDWTFYHLRPWILSWGYDCRVISPPELVRLVKDDIDKMCGLYKKEPKQDSKKLMGMHYEKNSR